MTLTNDAWMHDGTPRPCENDPELWFSTGPQDRQRAVRACVTCPLLQPCRAYALATRPPYGVWGALTEADRQPRERKPSPRLPDSEPVDCTQPTAFYQHRRRGEHCDTCTTRRAEEIQRGRRERLDREHKAHGGSMIGYHAHVALGEQPCPTCRAVNIERLAARRRTKRSPATARARTNAA